MQSWTETDGSAGCARRFARVFRMADDGIAEVWQEEVPEGFEDAAVEAQESCPVSVITVE